MSKLFKDNSNNKNILKQINHIKLKLELFIKNKNSANLHSGRVLQSSINQDFMIYLMSEDKDMSKFTKEIVNLSEEEQDSLRGINNNLKEILETINTFLSAE